MPKKILVFLFAVTCMMSFSFAMSDNREYGDIEINNVKMEYYENNRIISSFTITNNDENYLSDITYTITLKKKENAESNDFNITYKTLTSKTINILPYENKLEVFDVKLPDNMPEGEYGLFVKVRTRTVTIYSDTLYYGLGQKGEGSEFIFPTGQYEASHFLENAGDALTGPNYGATDKVTANIKLKSSLKNAVNATPQIKLYERSLEYNIKPIEEIKGKIVNIKPSKETDVAIDLPVYTKPSSYYAQVVFYDDSGKQLSYEYNFRYVIEGESAKILALKPSYNIETQALILRETYIGSADGTALINSDFTYTVTDSKTNEVIYTNTVNQKNLENAYTKNESIYIGEYRPLTITGKVTSNGKTLDEYIVKTPEGLDKKIEKVYFSDTIGTDYETPAKIMTGLNFVSGYPDNTFKPEKSITRAEFVVIASRLLNMEEVAGYKAGSENKFSDVPQGHWASNFIQYAYNNGIVSGYTDGTFGPDRTVTIQEATTMLLNVIGYKEKVNAQTYSWPYNYIITGTELGIAPLLDFEDYAVEATRGETIDMAYKAYLRKE